MVLGGRQATRSLVIADEITQLKIIGGHTGLSNFVPAVDLEVSGDVLIHGSFGIAGNLEGDILGNVTGNLFGDVCGNLITDSITQKGAAGVNIEGVIVDAGLITGNLTGNIVGDTTVTGDLTVQGSMTTFESIVVTASDPNLSIASSNIATDLVDVGIYATYNNAGVKYTGLLRDADDKCWKLFEELTVEPTTTADFSTGVLANVCANTILGNVVGNLQGSVTGDVVGNVTGDVTGDLTGNVVGNLQGDVVGDLTGDVTGDVEGNVVGNLQGDVTGDLLGDVTGNVTGDVEGNVIGNLQGDVTGDLLGDVTGNVVGNVVGDVCGNLQADNIFEKTTNAGVNVDGLVIKNGTIVGSVETVTGDGVGKDAISLDTMITHVDTSGGSSDLTLAAGTIGQLKIITMTAVSGSAILDDTDGNLAETVSITWDAIGETAQLAYNGTGWYIVSSRGVTIA